MLAEALIELSTQAVFSEMGSRWFEESRSVRVSQMSQAEVMLVDLKKPPPVWSSVLLTQECSGLQWYSDSHQMDLGERSG